MSEPDRVDELVHDMRNRLTVARANIEAFIDGKLDPSSTRLQAVLQSLNQIEELLSAFSASQAFAQMRRAQASKVDVCDLVDHECLALEPVASVKGITTIVRRSSLSPAGAAQFVGNPVLIGQIISNVLLEAVRLAVPGSTIALECSPRDGEFRISIARVSSGSSKDLSLAKRFVEENGGSVKPLPSDDGVLFLVRLPGTALPAP